MFYWKKLSKKYSIGQSPYLQVLISMKFKFFSLLWQHHEQSHFKIMFTNLQNSSVFIQHLYKYGLKKKKKNWKFAFIFLSQTMVQKCNIQAVH